MARVLAALFLVAVAVAAALAAWGVLENLWADYQDGSTATYLAVGLPLLALSVAALVGAVALLLRR